ncbi:MAG: PilZ domain-containing protein [Nitrospira sp.]|nr:PilZ domain-containing protein [Nitrospira sp.]
MTRVEERGAVKYPVASSLRHRGKALELDAAREMVILIGNNGEPIGSLSWDFVIDQIMACRKMPVQREVRSEPRVALTFRVRYRTPEGQHFESRAGGIGGGGMFIESLSPLPIGTRLAMEFSLPDNPEEWLPTKGIVAWICPKADHYTFSPGMGVQFTEIASEVRERILAVVSAVQNKGKESEVLQPT